MLAILKKVDHRGWSGIFMSSFIAVLLVTGSLRLGHAQQGAPKTMSVNEAEQFALAAVSPKLKRLPGFQFDNPQKNAEGLYVFNAIWQGLPDGSVNIGFYAVDPVTGTVWNSVMECQQVATRPLRALQLTRQVKLSMTVSQLRRLHAKGPQCS